MCNIPALCSMEEFRLRGPIASPPASGWRIISLPEAASDLQPVWNAYASSTNPENSKAAWWSMLEFLAANGHKSPSITKSVVKGSIIQWCSPDPRRCPKVNLADLSIYLPWAAKAWEDSNRKLHDGATNPGIILASIVAILTRLINGPEGCKHCAAHWRQLMKDHPAPANPTLSEARHWLVDRHNDTREGKVPTPFAEVAAKFNWTES